LSAFIREVTPDFTNRSVAGKTTISFKPIANPLAELSLDAVDLTVSAVNSSEKILDYPVSGSKALWTESEAA
jgi:aminopeptidase N